MSTNNSPGYEAGTSSGNNYNKRDPTQGDGPNGGGRQYMNTYPQQRYGGYGGNPNYRGGRRGGGRGGFTRRNFGYGGGRRYNNRNNFASRQSRRNKAHLDRSTTPLPERERVLFGTAQTQQGINFDTYEKIPVEMSGEDYPDPCQDFETSRLCEPLLANVKRCNFLKPTPVQKYSIPVILDKRDLMACAQTGSGKTAAFLLPAIHLLLEQCQPSIVTGRNSVFLPTCLILAPTRELAQQTHLQAQRFTYLTGMRSCVIYGGSDIRYQFDELDGGVDILVATPGRLFDCIDRKRISLTNIRILIMDEADRMLDMGFEPQIRQIVEECDMPPKADRQTLMYSATFPLEIQKLAQDFLENYIFLAVGRVGSATDFITQQVEYVPDFAKFGKLLEILPTYQGRTLIFTQTKKNADNLENFLTSQGMKVLAIHGDKSQRDREYALKQFRRGYCKILCATDVASRGLDIPNVKTVIQFDAPTHIDDYVHRIGRTGRCGNEGTALTFINEGNKPILVDLIHIIREAKQDVPQWYINMCGVVLSQNSKGPKFGGRDIRRGTGRDKNFGRKNRNLGHSKFESRGRGGGRRNNNYHHNNNRNNQHHNNHHQNNNHNNNNNNYHQGGGHNNHGGQHQNNHYNQQQQQTQQQQHHMRGQQQNVHHGGVHNQNHVQKNQQPMQTQPNIAYATQSYPPPVQNYTQNTFLPYVTTANPVSVDPSGQRYVTTPTQSVSFAQPTAQQQAISPSGAQQTQTKRQVPTSGMSNEQFQITSPNNKQFQMASANATQPQQPPYYVPADF